ncbi:hypothetical protein Lal_00012758 [Lupinus albus]|nr:hypothetical protein Lal_00012758 [Lupinus albus]
MSIIATRVPLAVNITVQRLDINGALAPSIASISANLNSVPVLNGTNFEDWKENMEIVLGCMDLDYALRVEQPPPPLESSTSEERKDYERWERSNRMCLMIIKRGIPEVFRGTVSEKISSAKFFLAEIEKRLAKSDKAETSTLLQNLISMRYHGKGNIREHIMGMSNIVSKLKALKLEMSEDLLIHLVLISLPAQFSKFKISYNCQKEKWTLNELISFCVQEEERMKQERTESAHFASTSRDKGKKKMIMEPKNEAAKGPVQKKQKQVTVCFFCKESGHLKKKCDKYHAWCAKKGTFLALVCSEVNLTSVPGNTWWLDSGSTSNISVSLQGCLNYRKPNFVEKYIFVGDGKSEHQSTHVLSGFPSSGANGKPSGSSNRNILQPTYLGAFGMANQSMRFLLHYETNWGFLRPGLGLFH